jgi:hypothetical protein
MLYSTAIVTVFDVTPPIEMVTGTAAPPGVPAGTSAFTWYSPTYPGARPEKIASPDTLPILTVGTVVVSARSGLPGAGDPLDG